MIYIELPGGCPPIPTVLGVRLTQSLRVGYCVVDWMKKYQQDFLLHLNYAITAQQQLISPYN